MTEVKLCKDCRFVALPGDASFASAGSRLDLLAMAAECRHSTAREEERLDLVSGVLKARWKACREHRGHGIHDTDNDCGPGARWFEPKEPPEPAIGGDDPDPRTDGALADPE